MRRTRVGKREETHQQNQTAVARRQEEAADHVHAVSGRSVYVGEDVCRGPVGAGDSASQYPAKRAQHRFARSGHAGR